MKCRADGNVRRLKPNKVQIYPGDWVQNLKAQGMKPPWGAKNHWVLQQKVKGQATIDAMLTNQRKSFGGARVEFMCEQLLQGEMYHAGTKPHTGPCTARTQ